MPIHPPRYRVRWLTSLWCVVLCLAGSGQSTAAAIPQENVASVARGIVYHDVNANRRHDEGEPLLPGISLSNGRDIVETNSQGRYEIGLPDESTLFVIKPRGWRTGLTDDQLPQFFYLHKPNGSPKQAFPGTPPTGPLPAAINFPLYPQEEPDRFQIVLFGDTQARDAREVGYIGNDVITELIGTTASFGVTLGDVVFDDLSLYSTHNQAVAQLRIPWFNVIGNHDLNIDATQRRYANETFESVYGPSYYAFQFGQVHFVVLDNCDWVLATPQEAAHFAPRFGPEQIEFLKNDLSRIPESQMVVLMMHIPIMQAVDREEVFRLIESRPLCISIAGHTHTHEHHFLTSADGWRGKSPHHHIVNVTVCGSWWSGQLDERGIPHALMTDGAPNGYSRLTFDGGQFRLDFKAAGRDPDYQMQISTQGPLIAGRLTDSKIFANVFNASEQSRVEMQIDGEGEWRELARTLAADPLYSQIYEREKKLTPPIEPGLAKPGVSTHLWQGSIPADLAAGTHTIEIRATEPDGRHVGGRHVVRIE